MSKEEYSTDYLLAYDATDLRLMSQAASRSGARLKTMPLGPHKRRTLAAYGNEATGMYRGIDMSRIRRDFAERVVAAGGYVVRLTAESSQPPRPGDSMFEFHRALGALRLGRAESIQRGHEPPPASLPHQEQASPNLPGIVYSNAA